MNNMNRVECENSYDDADSFRQQMVQAFNDLERHVGEGKLVDFTNSDGIWVVEKHDGQYALTLTGERGMSRYYLNSEGECYSDVKNLDLRVVLDAVEAIKGLNNNAEEQPSRGIFAFFYELMRGENEKRYLRLGNLYTNCVIKNYGSYFDIDVTDAADIKLKFRIDARGNTAIMTGDNQTFRLNAHVASVYLPEIIKLISEYRGMQ